MKLVGTEAVSAKELTETDSFLILYSPKSPPPRNPGPEERPLSQKCRILSGELRVTDLMSEDIFQFVRILAEVLHGFFRIFPIIFVEMLHHVWLDLNGFVVP